MKKILLLPLLFLIALLVSSCNGGKCNSAPADTFSASIDSFANGSTGISQTPSIQIKFTQAVLNVNTTTVSLYEQGASGKLQDVGSPIPITNITAGSNNSYTFSPLAPLTSNTTYVIALSNGITTLTGIALTPTTFNFTTGDSIAPMVSMITPANGGTGASLSQIIQLQFSESVTNVTTTSITLHAGSVTGTAVALGSMTAGSNNSYSFSATSPLLPSTTYYVVLSNAISDIAGNQLSATSFSFTTGSGGGDTTSPTVAMIAPTDNAESISITPSIIVQFSEPVTNVDTTSITLHESSTTGTAVALGNITVGSNNTYSFSATSPLSPLTTYYVVLSNAITDIAGNNQLSATSFSFTTGDFIAPTVSMVTPTNNAESVSITSSITLQFSESVINVDTTSITLHESSTTGASVALGNITAESNNSYSFSATSPLSPLTTYYVVLSNAISDIAGNQLSATSFSFTTAIVWRDVGNAGFSAGAADYTSLAIASDGTLYVAYTDGGNSNKATVMTFNGNSWVTVGNPGFSAGPVQYTSLAIASDGTPYVAYQDSGNSGEATVMKFDGVNWVNVGSPDFSAGGADYTSLAINSSGMPYVAYTDGGNSHQATVMKFDGTNWVTVGNPGFSAGGAFYTSLAISPNGTLYVAYQDGGNSYEATVMKFDGANWVNVGNAGFSAGAVQYTSLAIDSNDTPYVAYEDGTNSYKATVMKFDGTNWGDVGNAGFSAGSVTYTSLAIDSNGTPYVAYQDGDNSGEATVMKFDGSSWVSVGNAGFSVGIADYTSLAITSDGTPYVAYKDVANSGKATVMSYQ